MQAHPEIVQHCWKHAGLDSASTAKLLVSQPATHVPAEVPAAPSLPDAVQRANEELRELMEVMAERFPQPEQLDLHSYINVDADMDLTIHPLLTTEDIVAQVKHQLNPLDEPADEKDDDILPPITRTEHLQGLAWLQKFERYFPGKSCIQDVLHFMSLPDAVQVLPPLKQKTMDSYIVKK